MNAYSTYISKPNSNHEKQRITNGEGWYYLAVEKVLLVLRGTTSNHDGNFVLS